MRMEVARAIAGFADARGIGISLTIDDIEYHSAGYAGVSMIALREIERAAQALADGPPPVLMGVEGYEWARQIYAFCRTELDGEVHVTRHQMQDGTYTSATMVDPQAEKGHAVDTIRTLLGLERSEVLAIGDNESDGSMFKVAGTSVAVAGPAAPVNTCATHVAPYLDGDGVVWALEQFCGD